MASSSSSSSSSSAVDILSTAREYLCWELNAHHRQQVQPLVAAEDVSALSQLFQPRIAFGTAGLRAKMAAGYRFMNELVVLQTTQGILRYLEQQFGKQQLKQRGVIIGYDGRYDSRTYAVLAAEVFLSLDYPVYFFQHLTATPFVPFGLLHFHALAGIMCTASHNPKEDNGYKVYWENGAQIIPPHDVNISKHIDANLQPWKRYSITLPEHCQTLKYVDDELSSAYTAESTRLYHWRTNEENQHNRLRVTYTAMHGVGAPHVQKLFQSFHLPSYIPTRLQLHPDPEFRTVKFPNPEEGKGALSLAMAAADAASPPSPLILANDPDADRLAIAEKQAGEWRILNGNEIALLFADWAFRNYKSQCGGKQEDISKCIMIASTVSSKVLASMAAVEGFQFQDTLTGFKWIGNAAVAAIQQRHLHFLFAYEVEIGFLVGSLSFDKDGIRSAAIFNELAADLYEKQAKNCAARLKELYDKYGYFVMNTGYFFVDQPAVINDIFQRIRMLGGESAKNALNAFHYPHTICGETLSSIRDITHGFDSAQSDLKSLLPATPDSHMLSFVFTNGATITLRTSGTEPKLKFYVESKGNSKEVAEKITAKLGRDVLEELVQPKKHNLPQIWIIGPTQPK